MRYTTFLNGSLVAALCASSAAPLGAQLAELQPGARVRVRAPEAVAGRLEATVIARTGDTVTLTTPRGASILVPLSAITAAEVSRGRSRRDGAVRGLTWGSGVGLATGLVGAAGSNEDSRVCEAEGCYDDLSPAGYITVGVVSGALTGAAIGAIIGAEHWERLTIPARVAVRPSRGGAMLSVIVGF